MWESHSDHIMGAIAFQFQCMANRLFLKHSNAIYHHFRVLRDYKNRVYHGSETLQHSIGVYVSVSLCFGY